MYTQNFRDCSERKDPIAKKQPFRIFFSSIKAVDNQQSLRVLISAAEGNISGTVYESSGNVRGNDKIVLDITFHAASYQPGNPPRN